MIPTSVPRAGLVAEYLFRGDAHDTSGHGRHAVVHGAELTRDRFGAAQSAFRFNGRSWLEVAPAPTAGATAISVSVWALFDPRRMRGWTNCIVAQDNGDDSDHARRNFQLSADNGRVVWHRMIEARDPMYGRRVQFGVWYHFVGVAANGEHRLYVDGALQDSVPGAFASHPDQPLHIGRKGSNEEFFLFKGAIDDVRIYDRALTDAEVGILFNEGGFAKPSPQPARDIAGRWGRDGVVFFDLAHDGAGRVTGRVMAGKPSNMADIKTGSYDQATGRFVLAGAATHHENGTPVDFRIEGTVDGAEIAAVAHVVAHDRTMEYHGNHILSRRGARRRWWRDSWLREQLMLPLLRARRALWARSRPTKAFNTRRMRERGEQPALVTIRDATTDDIPSLSRVHVTAWNATYNTTRGPTVAIREHQWREAFSKSDGNWFVLVAENEAGDIVGFTRGIKRGNGTGDFNKLYLLTEYQRLGLGTRLVGHLARRFLAMGVTTMSGYVDSGNPSCAFFEHIGGHWGRDDAGRINYEWYVWDDLKEVAARCSM